MPPDSPFSRRALVVLPLAFIAALWVLHHMVWFVYRIAPFDCPPNWPFSIYNPRGPHTVWEFGALAATVLAALAAFRFLPRRDWRFGDVAAVGLLLILLTNAAQGVPRGFHNPVAGGKSGQQYWHDAGSVESTRTFLRDFNHIQPSLLTHARTHPPGAVLLYYAPRRAGIPPWAIAVGIAAFSALISAWAMRRLLTSLLDADERLAHCGTLLYLLLPAVQIYYCATLDAVIATLLLAAAAVWLRPPTVGATLAGTFLVAGASFLTFGVAWVVPVLFALDVARGIKSWWRILAVPFMLAAIYGLLYAATGFNWLTALRTASHLENPHGFRLLAEPRSYIFTRLEDVTEMAAFFGPYLLALFARGLPSLRREQKQAFLALLTALCTLAALFLTGAYHTGETARACIFLYPYLLLPVVHILRRVPERAQILVIALVLVQVTIMQGWGNWFW